MPVPGYDPEDIDDTLESHLGEDGLRERLSDEEWEAYQHEDASLVDILDESEIERLLDADGDGNDSGGSAAGDGTAEANDTSPDGEDD
ncbi:hypothetical protein [Halostella pelagica]|uniref:hypothetical protein n=1 Tax=Halostella pelagica TaxID=2583824 RepID=UPI00108205D7|nr:hypothetical protein [Halostella pelagica]